MKFVILGALMTLVLSANSFALEDGQYQLIRSENITVRFPTENDNSPKPAPQPGPSTILISGDTAQVDSKTCSFSYTTKRITINQLPIQRGILGRFAGKGPYKLTCPEQEPVHFIVLNDSGDYEAEDGDLLLEINNALQFYRR